MAESHRPFLGSFQEEHADTGATEGRPNESSDQAPRDVEIDMLRKQLAAAEQMAAAVHQELAQEKRARLEEELRNKLPQLGALLQLNEEGRHSPLFPQEHLPSFRDNTTAIERNRSPTQTAHKPFPSPTPEFAKEKSTGGQMSEESEETHVEASAEQSTNRDYDDDNASYTLRIDSKDCQDWDDATAVSGVHPPNATPRVKRWSKESFEAFLAQADHVTIPGTTTKIWQLLMQTEVRKDIAECIRGVKGFNNVVIDLEVGVDSALMTGVYGAIKEILGKAMLKADLGPTHSWECAPTRTGKRPALPSAATSFRPDIFFEFIIKEVTWALLLNESKVDWKFPRPLNSNEDADEALKTSLGDLFHYYYETEEGKKSTSNVLNQIMTYLGVFHRRLGIISTLNSWTFVRLRSNSTMLVSKRYFAMDSLTRSEQEYPLFEMLLRFIVMSLHEIGDWLSRPEFIKRFFEKRGHPKKDSDYDANPNNVEGPKSQSAGTGTSKSATSIRSRSVGSGSGRKHCLAPLCWADVEDPRRNSTPMVLTKEEEQSGLGTLEGDAKYIGTGRTGPAYRKTFGGVDTVFKVHYLLLKEKDDPSAEAIRNELQREELAYKLLGDLQGKIVPRFLGFGPLIPHVSDVFSTEYAGKEVRDFSQLDEETKQDALVRLKDIHNHGVLHGDIGNQHNLVLGRDDRLVFIDFGQCRLKEHDHVTDEEWEYLTEQEVNQLDRILHPGTNVTIRKRPLGSMDSNPLDKGFEGRKKQRDRRESLSAV